MEYAKINAPTDSTPSSSATVCLPLSNPLASLLKLRPSAPTPATPVAPEPTPESAESDEEPEAEPSNSNYIMVAGTLISTQPPPPPQVAQEPPPKKKWAPISLPKPSLAAIQSSQESTPTTWARAAAPKKVAFVEATDVSGVAEVAKSELVAGVRDKCVGYYLVAYPSGQAVLLSVVMCIGDCDIRSVPPAISFDVEKRQGNKV